MSSSDDDVTFNYNQKEPEEGEEEAGHQGGSNDGEVYREISERGTCNKKVLDNDMNVRVKDQADGDDDDDGEVTFNLNEEPEPEAELENIRNKMSASVKIGATKRGKQEKKQTKERINETKKAVDAKNKPATTHRRGKVLVKVENYLIRETPPLVSMAHAKVKTDPLQEGNEDKVNVDEEGEEGGDHAQKTESSESEEEDDEVTFNSGGDEDEYDAEELEKTGAYSEGEGEDESERAGGVTEVNLKELPFLERLQYARQMLQLSAHPSSFPGREEEMSRVKNYILSCLNNGTSDFLYISGTPGTGKTASVRAVINDLARNKTVLKFDHVEINGLQLTKPQQLYVEIYKKICKPVKRYGKNINIGTGDALALLRTTFENKKKINRRHCVLVVDEFDLLVTKKQQVIYNLCEWIHDRAKLIVIAIANTMNLPGTLNPKVQSRLGKNRLDFQAYSRTALEQIIISRIRNLTVFDSTAVTLTAARVSGISGDARRALEICRRALKIAERDLEKGETTDLAEEKVPLKYIDKAVAQMTPQHSLILKHAVLHQRLFMCSVVNEVKLTGKLETVFQNVAHKHLNLCRIHDIPPPPWHLLGAICQRLGDMKFLTVGNPALDVAQPIHLEIDMDDVIMAVAEDETCRKWLNM